MAQMNVAVGGRADGREGIRLILLEGLRWALQHQAEWVDMPCGAGDTCRHGNSDDCAVLKLITYVIDLDEPGYADHVRSIDLSSLKTPMRRGRPPVHSA